MDNRTILKSLGIDFDLSQVPFNRQVWHGGGERIGSGEREETSSVK